MNWLEDLNQAKRAVEAAKAQKAAADAAISREQQREKRVSHVNKLLGLLDWLGVPIQGVPTDYSHWSGEGEPPLDFLPEHVVVDSYVFTGSVMVSELERRVAQPSGIVDRQKYLCISFSLGVVKVMRLPQPASIRTPIYIEAPRQPAVRIHNELEPYSNQRWIELDDWSAKQFFKAHLADGIQYLDAQFPAYLEAVIGWDDKVKRLIEDHYAEQKAAEAKRAAWLIAQEEADRAWEETMRALEAEQQEKRRLEDEQRAKYRSEIARAFGVSTDAWDHLVQMVAESIEASRQSCDDDEF